MRWDPYVLLRSIRSLESSGAFVAYIRIAENVIGLHSLFYLTTMVELGCGKGAMFSLSGLKLNFMSIALGMSPS